MKVAQKELNERQKKFCREYIIDYSAQQAGIRAGYAPSSAHVRACLLLKLPMVQEEIARLLKKQVKRTEVSSDKVINELAGIAFGNLKDFEKAIAENNLDGLLSKLTREQAVFISTITQRELQGGNKQTTIKFHDKIKALELLMKHMGLLTEKLQIENVDKGISVEDLGLSLEEKKRILGLIQQAKLNKESIQE